MKKEDILEDKAEGFWIRFVGTDLVGRSVPIHDLSMTLLAVQRIIYKAHLVEKGRLTRFAAPTNKERAKLALHLGERCQESDAYCLLSNPLFVAILYPLIAKALWAIAEYMIKKIKEPRSKLKIPKSISENPLPFIIYPQLFL